MFGVGLPEFVAILVIALVVLGPERLPIAMRSLGRWLRRLRNMSREIRQEFAEEFAVFQEEMDFLRTEAAETRAELVAIRQELSQTIQETTDDITSVRDEIVDNVQGAVSGKRPSAAGAAAPNAAAPAATDSGTAASGAAAPGTATPDVAAPGKADSGTVVPATAAPGAAPGEAVVVASARPPLGPADVMAEAIADTFGSNGAVDGRLASPDAPTEAAAPPARLEAFAPDTQGPVEPSTGPAVAPPPPVTDQPSEADTPAVGLAAAGIGAAPEPSLHNQMGGFLRLMIMQALTESDDFRERAEDTLRAQARMDARRAAEIEDADILDIAEAWAAQRRQLVEHGSVTVEQKAPQSALIELRECPYRLTPGDAHPVCDVSNVYDAEYFKQFGATATYVQRMSDGANYCRMAVIANSRLRELGLEAQIDEDPIEDEPAPEPVAEPSA